MLANLTLLKWKATCLFTERVLLVLFSEKLSPMPIAPARREPNRAQSRMPVCLLYQTPHHNPSKYLAYVLPFWLQQKKPCQSNSAAGIPIPLDVLDII